MKKQEFKNQTFSLPVNITKELRTYVRRREMSHFVAEAIRKDLERKKEELRQAYLDANQDEGQNEARKDWESTVGDGLEDDEW